MNKHDSCFKRAVNKDVEPWIEILSRYSHSVFPFAHLQPALQSDIETLQEFQERRKSRIWPTPTVMAIAVCTESLNDLLKNCSLHPVSWMNVTCSDRWRQLIRKFCYPLRLFPGFPGKSNLLFVFDIHLSFLAPCQNEVFKKVLAQAWTCSPVCLSAHLQKLEYHGMTLQEVWWSLN